MNTKHYWTEERGVNNSTNYRLHLEQGPFHIQSASLAVNDAQTEAQWLDGMKRIASLLAEGKTPRDGLAYQLNYNHWQIPAQF